MPTGTGEAMLHSPAAAADADGPRDQREELQHQPRQAEQQQPHMHPAAAEDPAADHDNAAATTPTTSPAPTHAADRQTEDQAPPVFWSTRHARSASYHSLNPQHHGPGPIQLEDHSEDQHEQSRGCWARAVTVDDYTVVSGTSGIGAYVVWHCTVKTLKGGDMNIRKRYSEFDRLRHNLVQAFPHAQGSIPQLPRKSVVSRFRPKFLEQRKNGLNHFINCILLNPEFAASPIMKEFVFS